MLTPFGLWRGRFIRPLSYISDMEDFFILTDVRGGDNAIHSWDVLETSERQKAICELLMRNRRKNRFGSRDGNPMAYAAIHRLDPTVEEAELEELERIGILRRENGSWNFRFSKNSAGIFGVYRATPAGSLSFPTLTASGGADFVFDGQTREDLIRAVRSLLGLPI